MRWSRKNGLLRGSSRGTSQRGIPSISTCNPSTTPLRRRHHDEAATSARISADGARGRPMATARNVFDRTRKESRSAHRRQTEAGVCELLPSASAENLEKTISARPAAAPATVPQRPFGPPPEARGRTTRADPGDLEDEAQNGSAHRRRIERLSGQNQRNKQARDQARDDHDREHGRPPGPRIPPGRQRRQRPRDRRQPCRTADGLPVPFRRVFEHRPSDARSERGPAGAKDFAHTMGKTQGVRFRSPPDRHDDRSASIDPPDDLGRKHGFAYPGALRQSKRAAVHRRRNRQHPDPRVAGMTQDHCGDARRGQVVSDHRLLPRQSGPPRADPPLRARPRPRRVRPAMPEESCAARHPQEAYVHLFPTRRSGGSPPARRSRRRLPCRCDPPRVPSPPVWQY